MKLEQAFDLKSNSLNLLRVVLAASVIVSHSWPLGGFGPDPTIGGHALGEWAVAGFFAISGYLITSSRLRMPMAPFLLRRAARIMPGFWACLVVTAFIAAPLTALATGESYRPLSGFTYLVTNATLRMKQYGIADTLQTVPFRGAWNGSLWTLFWEFACYIGIGTLFLLARARRDPRFTGALWIALAALTMASTRIDLPSDLPAGLFLTTCFTAGAVLRMYDAHVPMGDAYAAVAVLVLVAVTMLGQFRGLGALPLGYLLMWLAIRLPFDRFGSRDDISYGLYIYAFVVQQMLAEAGVQRLGVAVFIYTSAALSVIPAWLSWRYVEKPAKDWSARWIRQRRIGQPLQSTSAQAGAQADAKG